MAAEFRCAWTDANIPPTVLYRCRKRTNRLPNRRQVQEHSTDDRAACEHKLLGRPTKVRFKSMSKSILYSTWLLIVCTYYIGT